MLLTEPLGPLLTVQPWNYPLYQVARIAAPNLVLGNTILLKHASTCPQSALALEDVFRYAGVPAGGFTNLFLETGDIADVIKSPRVHGVSLTGSEGAGAPVAEQAGRNIKKSVLELGGSDPFIVLDAEHLERTVRRGGQGPPREYGPELRGVQALHRPPRALRRVRVRHARSLRGAHAGRPGRPRHDTRPAVVGAGGPRPDGSGPDAVAKGATVIIGGGRPTFRARSSSRPS